MNLSFLSYFFANIMLLFYAYLGHNTIIAIAALTLLLNLAMLPLTLSQQRSMRKMQALQPELEKLQKKYGKDKERLAQEQWKLQREAGANPLLGCLPLLIQFPIWIGLIGAIRFCVPSTPLELFQFSHNIYKWLPGVVGLVPLQSTFLGMDLGQAPNPAQWWSYSLPVLVFVTSWLQQKLLTPPTAASSTQSQAGMMNKQMQIMMPLMFMFFTLTYATGLSIYFIISAVIRIAQYYAMREGEAMKKGDKEQAGTKPEKEKREKPQVAP